MADSPNAHVRELIARANPGKSYLSIIRAAGVQQYVLYEFVNQRREQIPSERKIQRMAEVIGCTTLELWVALARDCYPQYMKHQPVLDRIRVTLSHLPEPEWHTVAWLLEMAADLDLDQRRALYGMLGAELSRRGATDPMAAPRDDDGTESSQG